MLTSLSVITSPPAQLPKTKAQKIAMRRTHWGTAASSSRSNANQRPTFSHSASHEKIGRDQIPTKPSMVHNSPPAGCQPKYSDSAVFSTSSHAAEATLQFASTTIGRPNNVQVRNNS